MQEDLKRRLSANGQTMKWFFERYIKNDTGLTYTGFMSQINGYTRGLSASVKPIVEKFLSDCPE